MIDAATVPGGVQTLRVGRRQNLARWCQRARLLPVLGNMRSLVLGHLRILAYHRVLEAVEPDGFSFDTELVSASAEGFSRQMRWIGRHMHPMRFDQVLACVDAGERLPPRAVLVTFDDGYEDNHRVAYPVLRDAGVPAMFFVATGHIDSGLPFAYDWLVHMVCTTDEGVLDVPELGRSWTLPTGIAGRRAVAGQLLGRIKALDALAQSALIERLEREWGMPRAAHPHCRPMTWAQLREMQAGGMELGSHGVGHHMLAKLPRERMVAELVGSCEALQREVGVDVQVLSYPVGGLDAFDAQVQEAARAAGYRMACSYVAGSSPLGAAARFALRRLPVERGMDLAWFQAMLTLPELFSYRSPVRAG